MFRHRVKRALRGLGLDIRKFNRDAPDLQRLLQAYRVETIFDVGANIGQSAQHFRSMGFGGSIVSFEPIEYLFKSMEKKARRDPLWFVENVALGINPGKAEIHVSGGHAGASSLLKMTENVIRHAPDQRVVRTEQIEVDTLSTMLLKHYPHGDRCFLKVDVQGFERHVLEGGLDELHRVVGMKIELSVVSNYVGEPLLPEMLPYIYSLGFRSVSFENGWGNPVTGELFQVDCMFFRTSAISGKS